MFLTRVIFILFIICINVSGLRNAVVSVYLKALLALGKVVSGYRD